MEYPSHNRRPEPPPHLQWWRRFLFHLRITVCSRICYLHFILLFLKMLTKIIYVSIVYNEEELVRMLNTEVKQMIISFICVGCLILSRSVLIGVQKRDDEFWQTSPVNLMSTILCCWSIATVAHTSLNPRTSSLNVLFTFITSFVTTLRFINKQLNILDLSRSTPYPTLRLTEFLKEGAIQTMLSFLLSVVLFAFVSTFGSVVSLFLSANTAANVSDVMYTIRLFITLPLELCGLYVDGYNSFSWSDFINLICYTTWILSLLELHARLIQLSKDDMIYNMLDSIKQFPDVTDISQQNECLIAHAMYGAVKNAPLRYNSNMQRYELLRNTKCWQGGDTHRAPRNNDSLCTWLEKIWFWEDRKIYDVNPLFWLNESGGGGSNLLNDMLDKSGEYKLWMRYKSAATNKFAEVNNNLLMHLEANDKAEKKSFSSKQKYSSLRHRHQQYSNSYNKQHAMENKTPVESPPQFFNSYEIANLAICILYLRGLTEWLCIANAYPAEKRRRDSVDIINRTLRDTVVHAGTFIYLMEELWKAYETHISPEACMKLERLGSAANDSLKKLKCYKFEILVLQNEVNSRVQHTIASVYNM